MYKEAIFNKTTVQTNYGLLRADQLVDLSTKELDELAVALEAEYESSRGKSFIAKKTRKDKNVKFKFNLVLDILETKLDMETKTSTAAQIKAHNTKIDELILAKQEEATANLSIEELEKLRK